MTGEFRPTILTEGEPEKNAERVGAEIEKAFQEFRKNTNVPALFERLKKIKEQNLVSIFEEAWKQEQIDSFLNILNDDSLFLEVAHPAYYQDFQSILCQGKSQDKATGNQLNKRVFNSLTKRLYGRKDREMSDFLLTLSSQLDYPLFPNDSVTDDDFCQDLFGADYIVDSWVKTYEKNPDSFLRSLKILKGARTFLAQGNEGAFYGRYMESGADYIIDQIENSDSYFIKRGIEAYVDRAPFEDLPIELKKELLQYYVPGYDKTKENEILRDFNDYLNEDGVFRENARRADNRFRLEKYDEPQLRETSSIKPLVDSKDYAAYSAISPGLAVIYNYNSQVDSFFTLGEFSQRLTLIEVLRREGFNEKLLSAEDYRTLLYNYKALIEIPLREKIENEFKIRLKDFSVRQQIQFLNFLSAKTTDQIELARKFMVESSDYSRNNKVKSFLSLELDRNNGDRILKISEKLKSEDADKVFAKIAEIIDKTEEDLAGIIDKDDIGINLDEIRVELLRKAHQIILDFSGEEKDAGKLLRDLENSKVGITLLASLLKVAKASDIKLTPENIREMKIESYEIGELIEEYGVEYLNMRLKRESFKD